MSFCKLSAGVRKPTSQLLHDHGIKPKIIRPAAAELLG